MARPPKPEDQRAALVVGVRLTSAEKALVDQLTAPGPDGAPPRWTSASGLLRGLLHREAQRRGLEPPDPDDPDGARSPRPPAARGEGPECPEPAPPAGPPVPAPATLLVALGGGTLPAGTLLLVWPPGWPLPVAPGSEPPPLAPPAPSPPSPPGEPAAPGGVPPSVPVPPSRPEPSAPSVGGTFHGSGALPVEAPRGVGPVPTPPAPGGAPPSRTPAPVEASPAKRDALSPARPLPPMPEPSKMLARFERLLERLPGVLAKDVAAAAGLKPQDLSTFRQGRRITEEKRAKLWAWMNRPDGAE